MGMFGGSSDPKPIQISGEPADPIASDPGEIARRRAAAQRRRRAVTALRVDEGEAGTGLRIGGT